MANLLGSTKLFFKRNSATILTCIGGAGVVATSVMAVKATPKALTLLKEAREEKGEDLTKLEVVQVAGPSYIPAAITGVATIACIFGANVLNKRQQAALMSAYALVDSSYKDFRKKTEDLYGKDATHNVRKEIAKDKYEEMEIVRIGDKQLFYDAFSERYFESTLEEVMNAEYKLNRQIAIATGAYLNEFYEFLGIDPIPAGQELGWSNGILEAMYWINWVDFYHSREVTDDGTEYCMIIMMQEPVIDFAYY